MRKQKIMKKKKTLQEYCDTELFLDESRVVDAYALNKQDMS